MAEERLNPLTWLQGKFASLVHTHTKSDITDFTHTHTYSDISNVSVVTVNVTYSDSTTGTIKLLQYTGS